MPVNGSGSVHMAYLCVLALLLACCSCATADESNRLTEREKEQGFKLLFDGKSMDHWRNYRAEGIKPQWQVIDGAMVLTEKGGKDLVTKEKFAFFDLRLEWAIVEGGNSGIMFRVNEQTPRRLPWSAAAEPKCSGARSPGRPPRW